MNHISFLFTPVGHYITRLAAATGIGGIAGGQKGAVIGAATTTFFTLASPAIITQTLWRTAQAIRIGAPLAGVGGRSILSIVPRAGAMQAAGKKPGGVGSGALVVGYALGAGVGTGLVYAAEKAGWVEEGSAENLGDMYLSLATPFGTKSSGEAAKEFIGWGERVGISDIPRLLNEKALEERRAQQAVAGNAAGIPEGTVIDPSTGLPRAASPRVQAYIDMYTSGQYIGY